MADSQNSRLVCHLNLNLQKMFMKLAEWLKYHLRNLYSIYFSVLSSIESLIDQYQVEMCESITHCEFTLRILEHLHILTELFTVFCVKWQNNMAASILPF